MTTHDPNHTEEMKQHETDGCSNPCEGHLQWLRDKCPDCPTTFGQVIEALKDGKIAYRKGWHGKQLDREMYIYCPIYTDPHYDGGATIETINTPTGMKELQPFLALVVNESLIYGWLASQTDMLAEDWVIEEVQQ